MTTTFELPDIGEDAEEGILVTYHVSPGETVAENQLLAEVETDKSVVEVTAPEPLTIVDLGAEEGDVVEVGDSIATYEPAEEPPEAAETTDEPTSSSGETVPTAVHRDELPEDAPETGAIDAIPEQTEVLIIGAGPGGYVAAIRAGQLGLDVTLVEKDAVGGTCLNYGCIPSKALIHGGDIAYEAANAEALGISADPDVDIDKLVDWKNGVVEQLTSGVEQLCERAGVTIVEGHAEFLTSRRAKISTADGETAIDFGHVIVATGSQPIELPGFSFDSEYVFNSKEALALETLPDSLVVIGAGYIGMELSTVFQKLGTDVTVVEMVDDVLAGYEDDVSRIVRERAEEFGIDFRFEETASSWAETDDGVTLQTEDGSEIAAEKIFVVVGRKPATQSLNLEAAGIELDDDGFIQTDAQGRTSCEHIFAIGDVVGQPMLAHKASREGEVAAEAIAGKPAVLDYQAMPAAVFSDPEVATVGLKRAEARSAGYEPVVGQMPLRANGRALTLGDTEGFVRIVADEVTGLVLGAQIVGPNASELIAEVSLAIEMDARLNDIAQTVHTHPTLAEAVMEATANARGEAIHTTN